LIGPALDWAVAKIENPEWWDDGYMDVNPEAAVDMGDGETYSPSTDWAQGGPIIEREWINIEKRINEMHWTASVVYEDKEHDGFERTEAKGDTPLIAAMRCYVASKLGDEVEIPEELA